MKSRPVTMSLMSIVHSLMLLQVIVRYISFCVRSAYILLFMPVPLLGRSRGIVFMLSMCPSVLLFSRYL